MSISNINNFELEINISNNNSPLKENNIQILPSELLQRIFSFLNNYSLQSSVTVCQFWKQNVITFVKFKEYGSINRFFKISLEINLAEKLNNIPNEYRTNQPSDSLVAIKRSIFLLREKILNILKDENIEKLNQLKKLFFEEKFEGFSENMFGLAKTYQTIDFLMFLPGVDLEQWNEILIDLKKNSCQMKLRQIKMFIDQVKIKDIEEDIADINSCSDND